MLIISQEFLLRELLIKHRKPYNRDTRERQIVKLVKHTIIHSRPREQTNDSKPKQWHHKQDILIEHIANQIAISSIGLSPMHKEQILQESELSNSIVLKLWLLVSLRGH